MVGAGVAVAPNPFVVREEEGMLLVVACAPACAPASQALLLAGPGVAAAPTHVGAR